MRFVAVFLGRTVLGLGAAALGYGLLREPYQDTVAKLAGRLVGSLEQGLGLALLDGGAIVGGTPAVVAVAVERTSLDVVLVGAVLFAALLAGTPRRALSARAFWAIALLLALQVVIVALAGWGSYLDRKGAGSLGSEALQLLGAYGGLIAPLPLWLWAGGGAWLRPLFPKQNAASEAPPPRNRPSYAPRNGPCPCGCGRKAKRCVTLPAEAR